MKQKLLPLAFIVFFLTTNYDNLAQINTSTLPLTADSLATGNSKDIVKSFFQLALDRFTSANKKIQFTSNPFAVMAKMNPELLIDTNYIKYTHLRNLNFSFAGKLDSAYRFNGFSSGVKYALINHRDETISRAFVELAANANDEINLLNTALDRYIGTIDINNPQRKLFRDEKTKMLKGKVNFNQLDIL